MSTSRMSAVLAAATSIAAACVLPAADAAVPDWSGRYSLVTFASQKTGSSVAARQAEPDFSAQFVFATDCSGGRCVATVVDGPAPGNPTVPRPQQYSWDGARWVNTYDWQWECFRGGDVTPEYAPARSAAFYAPSPDGSMFGTWRTEIYSGLCKGTVVMPVAAYPA